MCSWHGVIIPDWEFPHFRSVCNQTIKSFFCFLVSDDNMINFVCYRPIRYQDTEKNLQLFNCRLAYCHFKLSCLCFFTRKCTCSLLQLMFLLTLELSSGYFHLFCNVFIFIIILISNILECFFLICIVSFAIYKQ